MTRRRDPRSLDESERRLWSQVTRDVAPLGDGAPAGDDGPVADAGATKKRVQTQDAPARRRPHGAGVKSPPAPVPPAPPAPHDRGTLDAGLQRRLRRGRIEPDARIDLHGMTQTQAHQRLRVGIPRLRAAGRRCLLVVTGKGSASALSRHTLHGDTISPAPERRGVLRDNLPRWLAEPEFRLHVAAIRPAHPRHGGGGAFYVWLRRQR